MLALALIALLAAVAVIASRVIFSQLGNTRFFVDQLSAIAAAGLHILVFTAAVGTISMALLEAIKRLFPIRGYFHRGQLERWLGDQALSAIVFLLRPSAAALGLADLAKTFNLSQQSPAPPLPAPAHPLPPTWDLVERSWFDVPLEQLIAQIGTLAQQELDMLSAGRPLYVGERSGAPGLVDALVGVSVSETLTASKPGLVQPPEERATLVANLRSQMEIALDALQVAIGNRWRRSVRLASCIVGTGIAVSLLLFSKVSPGLGVAAVLGTFFIGGFFSWLARDIVAGVERWRR